MKSNVTCIHAELFYDISNVNWLNAVHFCAVQH